MISTKIIFQNHKTVVIRKTQKVPKSHKGFLLINIIQSF